MTGRCTIVPLHRKVSADLPLPAVAKVLNDTAACGLRRRATDAAEGKLVSQLIDRDWLVRADGYLRLTREGELERQRLLRQLRQAGQAARGSYTGSPF